MIPQLDFTKAPPSTTPLHVLMGNPYPEPATHWNKIKRAMGVPGHLTKKKIVSIKKAPKQINFTKAVRAQLVTADVMYSLVVNYEPSDLSTQQPVIAAAGALRAIKDIQKIHWNGEDPHWHPTAFKVYGQMVGKVHAIIEASAGDTMSYDFFNCCLMLADDMSVEAKKSKDIWLHDAWDRLVRFVRAMYLAEDPELNRWDAMLQGDELGQTLQAAIG